MTAARRFQCTAAGAIAAGQRRLGRLFTALIAICVAAAAHAWWSERRLPAVLALAVAALILFTRRLARELDCRELEVRGGVLVVRMRQHRREVPLAEASARTLERSEIEHLELLAARGGVVAGAGSFDSHLLGELDLVATDLAHAVLVESGDERLVVTPDDPTAFCRAIARSRRSPTAPAV